MRINTKQLGMMTLLAALAYSVIGCSSGGLPNEATNSLSVATPTVKLQIYVDCGALSCLNQIPTGTTVTFRAEGGDENYTFSVLREGALVSYSGNTFLMDAAGVYTVRVQDLSDFSEQKITAYVPAPSCTGGQILQADNSCACPSGQTLVSGTCQVVYTPPATHAIFRYDYAAITGFGIATSGFHYHNESASRPEPGLNGAANGVGTQVYKLVSSASVSGVIPLRRCLVPNTTIVFDSTGSNGYNCEGPQFSEPQQSFILGYVYPPTAANPDPAHLVELHRYKRAINGFYGYAGDDNIVQVGTAGNPPAGYEHSRLLGYVPAQ